MPSFVLLDSKIPIKPSEQNRCRSKEPLSTQLSKDRSFAATQHSERSTRDRALVLTRRATQPLELLGIPIPESARWASTAEAIIIDLAKAAYNSDQWISFSLNRNWYQGRRSWSCEIWFSYQAIKQATDYLEAIGAVTIEKASRTGPSGVQSRMRLADQFFASAFQIRVHSRPAALFAVVVRGNDKKTMPFALSRFESELEEMDQINAVQSRNIVTLQGRTFGNIAVLPADSKGNQRRAVFCDETALYRVFNNNSEELGGRLYGPWYQNMPKWLRQDLRLNGEITAEADYRSLHPKLLYASAGVALLDDPYDVAGYNRDVLKIAVNALINAANEREAVRVLTDARQWLSKGIEPPFLGEGAQARALRLIAAIKQHHPVIEQQFHSGAGLRLQRVDSDIIVRVLIRLAAEGIAALPMHDAVITQRKHVQRVAVVMFEEFAAKFPQAAKGFSRVNQLVKITAKMDDRSYIRGG